MIRGSSKRMTVARLAQRIDRRFDAVDKRFDRVDQRFAAIERGLISIGDKLDSITRRLVGRLQDHYKILDEHDERLKDLEAGHQAI